MVYQYVFNEEKKYENKSIRTKLLWFILYINTIHLFANHSIRTKLLWFILNKKRYNVTRL